METYVYTMRGTVAHLAPDGLNPICGTVLPGTFFFEVCGLG